MKGMKLLFSHYGTRGGGPHATRFNIPRYVLVKYDDDGRPISKHKLGNCRGAWVRMLNGKMKCDEEDKAHVKALPEACDAAIEAGGPPHLADHPEIENLPLSADQASALRVAKRKVAEAARVVRVENGEEQNLSEEEKARKKKKVVVEQRANATLHRSGVSACGLARAHTQLAEVSGKEFTR
ncbi:hypothetical protein JCM11641_003319 [Rhodosporidiobolus odoratus]